MNKLIKKANVLIKYGGKAMTDDQLKDGFAQDVVLMKYVGLNPVIVHGGGPQINQMLDHLGIEAKFRQGVRVTDRATMEVVEMVLGGKINKEIVNLLNQHGGRAVGLTGKDGGMIMAKPLTVKAWAESLGTEPDGADDADFGLVGEVQSVNPRLIEKLQQESFIPVIAPIGADRSGNAKGSHVSTLSRKDMQKMVKKGTISEGMLPKVQSCLAALDGGVQKAHIIDGRMPHAILLEIFTDRGIGTEIVS
jgi:acetylglutamate kinase